MGCLSCCVDKEGPEPFTPCAGLLLIGSPNHFTASLNTGNREPQQTSSRPTGRHERAHSSHINEKMLTLQECVRKPLAGLRPQQQKNQKQSTVPATAWGKERSGPLLEVINVMKDQIRGGHYMRSLIQDF